MLLRTLRALVAAAVVGSPSVLCAARALPFDLPLAYIGDIDPDFRVSDELLSVFKPGRFTIPREEEPDDVYNFRLFTPLPNPVYEKFPLIVWVHGHGEYELTAPNVGQQKNVQPLIFRDLEHLEKYPFYFLCVQCPKDRPWLEERGDGGRPDPAEATLMIVDKMIAESPIDPKRVYLVGISSGGSAAWTMLERRPDLFAAVAPLACMPAISKWSEEIAQVKVWSFRSQSDTSPTGSDAMAITEALRRAGDRAALTVVESKSHDAWTTAFLDYGLLDWLLAQRRGCTDCPPPGSLSPAIRFGLFARSSIGLRAYWPHGLVVLGAATIAWAVRRARKCRVL